MRHRAQYTDSPSALVDEWARRLAGRVPRRRRALDLAMGRGRNVVPLGRAGFRVFGVDIRLDAVRDAVATGAAAGVQVRGWCADLTACGLPCQSFELIVIARYLQRNLVHALRDAVVPGGAVIYETFTVAQRELGRGPTSADHLLLPGELAAQFEGFEVLLSEEVEGPEAVARFVGLKP